MKRIFSLIILFCGSLTAMQQEQENSLVVACDFDAISPNASTSSIIGSAIKNASSILKHLSLFQIASLACHLRKITQRAEAIALETPGISNTIHQLFNELQAEGYGDFSADIVQLCKAGIQPVPNKPCIQILKILKDLNVHLIGFGSKKDSNEFNFYQEHLKSSRDSIDLSEIFDGIVTIPSLQEYEQVFKPNPSLQYYQRTPSTYSWFVARSHEPEKTFSNTIQLLAKHIAGESMKLKIVADERELKELPDTIRGN